MRNNILLFPKLKFVHQYFLCTSLGTVLCISVSPRPLGLETRVIIKISTHSCYPRIFDCFSWIKQNFFLCFLPVLGLMLDSLTKQVKLVSTFKLQNTGYCRNELEFLRFLLTGKIYICQQIRCHQNF